MRRRRTIGCAIQRGRLSAQRKDDGNYAIDSDEVFRVYPPRAGVNPIQNASTAQGAHGLAPPVDVVLRTEIERLCAQLALMLERLDDLLQRETKAEEWANRVEERAEFADARADRRQVDQRIKRRFLGWLRG